MRDSGLLWLYAVLGILATFRISYMIALEDGPGDMFKRLRDLTNPVPFLDKLIECPHCVGVWVAAIVTAGFLWVGVIEWRESVLWLFAIAGGSTLWHLFRPKDD